MPLVNQKDLNQTQNLFLPDSHTNTILRRLEAPIGAETSFPQATSSVGAE